MTDLDTVVTVATRHHSALGGLAALLAASVESLTAAERESPLGQLLAGVAALVDQQREHGAAILHLVEDVADTINERT